MADPFLPRPQSPILDASGQLTPEWYNFFLDVLAMADEQTNVEAQIAVLTAAVAEIQAAIADLGSVNGGLSVEVAGSLTDGGKLFLRLVNDEVAPASTHYYGTNDDGTKGWHPIADALAQVDGIALTVDPVTGVITIGPGADLAAVEALTGTGIAERTGADTWALRTIGVGAGASVPDRDAADTRYQPLDGTLTGLSGAAPLLPTLVNAVDDTAAAGAGVPVQGIYRNGSVLQIRVT